MAIETLSPLRVAVTRNDYCESSHNCHVVVAHAHDGPIIQWGDTARPMYPRSSIKMLQAISFVKYGAADHFSCSGEEIALACASHNGEATHTEKVQAWLDRIGMNVSDLRCGSHPPYSRKSYESILRSGDAVTALANNCSGKHTAMLCLALHMGVPPQDYHHYEHKVQETIMTEISSFIGFSLAKANWGIDGCGVPNWQIPLDQYTHALARFSCPKVQAEDDRETTTRIWDAMTRYPALISGRYAFDTMVMEYGNGDVICKTGAEGFCISVQRSTNIAIAIKCEDGHIRGAHAATLYLMEQMGWLGADKERYQRILRPILNVAGLAVGRIYAEPEAKHTKQIRSLA